MNVPSIISCVSELYLLASALTIAGTALWGTSGVFYNAYLPLLVDAHPGVRQAQIEADAELEQFRVVRRLSSESVLITPQTLPPHVVATAELSAGDQDPRLATAKLAQRRNSTTDARLHLYTSTECCQQTVDGIV